MRHVAFFSLGLTNLPSEKMMNLLAIEEKRISNREFSAENSVKELKIKAKKIK